MQVFLDSESLQSKFQVFTQRPHNRQKNKCSMQIIKEKINIIGKSIDCSICIRCNISDINSQKLQQMLSSTPDCVLILGSCDMLYENMKALQISVYRDGGTCEFYETKFQDYPMEYCSTFNFQEYCCSSSEAIAKKFFLRFGNGQYGKFSKSIDEEILKKMVEKYISE